MNSTLMAEYIRYCADRLLESLGNPAVYGAKCPFDFMGNISLQGKVSWLFYIPVLRKES